MAHPSPVYTWRPAHEWLIVAYHAREHLAAGATKFDAMKRAQRYLAKARRLSDEELAKRSRPSHKALERAIERLARMTHEQVVDLVGEFNEDGHKVPQLYVPRLGTKVTGPDYAGGHSRVIKWKPIEWALLARRTRHWQRLGTNAGEVRLVIEAQDIELPAERRRSRSGLSVNAHKHLHPLIEQGATEWAHLVADIPFDPAQTKWRKALVLPVVDVITDPVPAPKPVEAPIPVQAPTPLENRDRPLAAPPGPVPGPVPAAPAAPAYDTPAHEAARWFGISLANALVPLVEQMLTSHEEHVLVKVRQEQRLQGNVLAESMSKLLLEGLDRMLGGGSINPQQPAAPAAPFDFGEEESAQLQQSQARAAEEEQQLPRLKIDVVGFEQGGHKMLVKQMLNGTGDRLDLRFIHPDERGTYTPSRERAVILLTQRVPHTLRDKIKSAGCKTYYVKRSVGDVVQTITDLVAAAA